MYTMIYMYYIDKSDFCTVLELLQRIPGYVTDAEKLLKKILPMLNKRG